MHSIDHLIDLALQEDIGPGDITTDNLVPVDLQGFGFVVAKQAFVLAGLDIAKKVFQRLDADIRFQTDWIDGDPIDIGRRVFEISGSLRTLLTGERTALNFLQRLSGIATAARDYVNQLNDSALRLVDTRKTTPGWRVLEKYAVRVGGACNHRMGLYDGVLIKDNHIAVCGGIAQAIELARRNVSHLVKIEVEVTDLEGVKEALDAGADVIMLDNMNIDQIGEAAAFIQGKAVVEVSGGITRKDLSALAHAGVNIVSVGALTHSAVAVDMSMQIQASSR